VQHNWVIFALGRRCADCGLTQENGAFEDDVAVCTPKSTPPSKPQRRQPRTQDA